MIIGGRVRELRIQRGYKREEFADIIGVSLNTVATVEQGKAGLSFETIQAFADALDVPPGALFPQSRNDNDADRLIEDLLIQARGLRKSDLCAIVRQVRALVDHDKRPRRKL